MVLRLATRTKTSWGLFRLRAEEDHGATAVEYAIMLALIAAVIVVGVTVLGQGTDNGFKTVTFPP
jgi:pilus assembly protein Flp/PilA